MERIAFIAILALAIGCAKSRHKESGSQSPVAVPLAESQIVNSLHQLLRVPVLNESTSIGVMNSLDRVEIPTSELLAADGRRFSLLLDHDAGLVWVLTTGGIGDHINETTGPWLIDNLNVTLLRKAIADNADSSSSVDQSRPNVSDEQADAPERR